MGDGGHMECFVCHVKFLGIYAVSNGQSLKDFKQWINIVRFVHKLIL